MSASIVIQQPRGDADRLLLLFHGVGANARTLVPLGEQLADAFPHAFVVSVDGAHSSDLGAGRQWFSVRGITEENRAERIAVAMPGFLDAIRHWQDVAQVGVDATSLIGFSQGAIMALASTQTLAPPAARVAAIAGRFARSPSRAPKSVAVHFLHGQVDSVIPHVHSVMGAERWGALGGKATLDLFPFAGHGIEPEMAARVVERLRSGVPG